MTGFHPYAIDRKPEELTATYTVDFSDRLDLFKAFVDKYGSVENGKVILRKIQGTNKIRITF